VNFHRPNASSHSTHKVIKGAIISLSTQKTDQSTA